MARRRLIEIEPPDSPTVTIRVGGPKKYYRTKKVGRLFARPGKYAYEKLEIDWLKPIIDELRLARIRQGLSQRGLAKLLKTGQGEVSQLETGKSNPTAEFLDRVIQALGVKIEIRLNSE